jgi:murein DD-endopeptidase MepM/ murein hydrolase activator NlpD
MGTFFQICAAALVTLVMTVACAFAEEMRPPRLTYIHSDWSVVAADLRAYQTAEPAEQASAIARLNRATGDLFPDIAASPVPVLLPFDTAAFLKDRAAEVADRPIDDYLSGFHPSPFFLSGPAGYDAMFTAQASDLPGLGIHFSGQIQVFISGFAFLYDLDEPAGLVERPVKGLAADYPGIRHFFLENYARATFTRYGVPYAISILCFDGGARFRMISCRDAGKVADHFLRALHLAGGTQQPPREAGEPTTIGRPAAASADFTFHPAGDLIPGTGYKGLGGRPDETVYSRMHFPLAAAPAFANSQSFMNWGNCDSTGRVSLGSVGGLPAYRCRLGGPTLLSDEAATANYSYPWRDNFCEHRAFYVGQCPGGLGHQGQDIRPGSCQQRAVGANRCLPYRHDVVAVRDGMVLRGAGQMPVYLFVNAENEHIRFRYLHMFPRRLDEDGIFTGRRLAEGTDIGKVGNFSRHEGATSYHLHFDMQVPTRYGWVFVNPYMTLVAAYERLIGGRGREVRDDLPAAPAAGGQDLPVLRAKAGPHGVESEGDDRVESPDDERGKHTLPVPAKGDQSPRLGNGPAPAGAGLGADHEGAVRPVGRELPRAGARARNLRRDLYAGHARTKAGHHRL